MIWDASRVKIIEVDCIHMDEAEDILEEFYDSYSTINVLGGKVC